MTTRHDPQVWGAEDRPLELIARNVSSRYLAIVIDGDQQHAAYAKDVSKCGLGFYSPVHLLPRTVIRLWVPGRALLRLRITRCRRLGERTYECGSVYEAVTQGPRR